MSENKQVWTNTEIRVLRARYGESQAKFCGRLGMAISSYRHLEQGSHKPRRWTVIILDRLLADLPPVLV